MVEKGQSDGSDGEESRKTTIDADGLYFELTDPDNT